MLDITFYKKQNNVSWKKYQKLNGTDVFNYML